MKKLAAFKLFSLELFIYSVFVFGYFYLVLLYLTGWLKELYDYHPSLYAIIALLLIAGQGIFLEMITTYLMHWIQPQRK